MNVIKRDGTIEEFNKSKIQKAIEGAFKSTNEILPEYLLDMIDSLFSQIDEENINVEEIQDKLENILMNDKFFNVAKEFILYREKHKQARFIRERLDYMNSYINSSNNAATSSETDSNANVSIKNVANLESEVYKTTNRVIQRQRMKLQLKKMFPEVAANYEEDLNHHIIYVHDEASTPVLKNYCEAVSLYPLLLEGVGNIDGITPKSPSNLNSFCGQLVNLAFLLSSQCKGAVAFGGLFIAFNYYCIKELGEDYYKRTNDIVFSDNINNKRTIEEYIIQYFQQIIWGINQPAGNRAYQSPLKNLALSNKFCIFAENNL